MVRQQKNEELMAAGVTLIDPATTYVDADVVVGADTVIYPCVFSRAPTKIGSACEIHSGTRIRQLDHRRSRVCQEPHCGSRIPQSKPVRFSVRSPTSGPAPASGEDVHVGNFVELKKTAMGKGAKANHLAYLGDADDRRENQRRRGHHHLQIRRREEAPDDDWVGSVRGSNSTLVAP
jgi:bifunctional UDP-N-acetylglucosamine pyrophosphorylase/glucosamine-1-phosphate N-acetyltransferase